MNHTHKFDKSTMISVPEVGQAEIDESRHADVVAVDFLDSGGLILHYERDGIYAVPPGKWTSVMTDFED